METSRKRQRVEEAEEHHLEDNTPVLEPGTTGTEMEEAESTVRDEKFYFEGADCVIRIENTLFKVHKFLLSRDSPVFQDMFALPLGPDTTQPEGSSDLNPIVLWGDDLNYFRALLSVLYALPSEIDKFRMATGMSGVHVVDVLCAIASITDKYQFTSIKTWTIEVLEHHVTTAITSAESHLGVASSHMRRILEIAHLQGLTRLETLVVTLWRESLRRNAVPAGDAVVIADKYGVLPLMGPAYYAQLMQLKPGFQISKRATGVELSAKQKARLLSGYWSLTHRWEHELSKNPPSYPQASLCTYHERVCQPYWKSIWARIAKGQKISDIPLADVIGRLNFIQQELNNNPDPTRTPCFQLAMVALTAKVEEVYNGLADHFVDLSTKRV